jgi:hypothetical protein
MGLDKLAGLVQDADSPILARVDTAEKFAVHILPHSTGFLISQGWGQ